MVRRFRNRVATLPSGRQHRMTVLPLLLSFKGVCGWDAGMESVENNCVGALSSSRGAHVFISLSTQTGHRGTGRQAMATLLQLRWLGYFFFLCRSSIHCAFRQLFLPFLFFFLLSILSLSPYYSYAFSFTLIFCHSYSRFLLLNISRRQGHLPQGPRPRTTFLDTKNSPHSHHPLN